MFYSSSLMYSNIFIVFHMVREGFSQRQEGFWMVFSCYEPKIESISCYEPKKSRAFPRPFQDGETGHMWVGFELEL